MLEMQAPPGSSHLSSAPRGPPTSSPFAGVRDLPGFAPYRPGAGMTISSILGMGEERKPMGSPHMSASGMLGTAKTMPPPSPGRVRASSMRESLPRREPSPALVSMFGEPRAQSAFHERNGQESRRDRFPSPRFQGESPHSFRAFRPDQPDGGPTPPNGTAMLGRPSSQPIELAAPRSVEEIIARRGSPAESRYGAFRHFGELPRTERVHRHDAHPFPTGVTSQPREVQDVFDSPRTDRDLRYPLTQSQPPMFSTPMREDQAGLFRPVFQPTADAARESIESRPLHEMRRDETHMSPSMSDIPLYLRGRNGFMDRPMTFEEHQRMEAMQREGSRKGSDGSGPRSLLGISPELNRKGRNSPLPQAVQGAQPRFVGPGGDNPGIKMEFGRMFSGLGSGVGSATPVAGQSANGGMTPSRGSPIRNIDDRELGRSMNNIEDAKTGPKARNSRKSGRRPREEDGIDGDGRMTPDAQRSNKRAKTSAPSHHHHHHLHGHHHHHHHHESEPQAGTFNMLRFPPNPTLSSAPSAPSHYHHHHHATHAHPAHHHHHHATKAAPPPRRPTITVLSKEVLDSVVGKPRKHLGSQLYATSVSQSPNSKLTLHSKLKYSSETKPIPYFEGQENCTFTIRIPRSYLISSDNAKPCGVPSPLEELCRHAQLWGTEIYTDDSDPIAAAVHSGWILGDYGDANIDLHALVEDTTAAENGGDEIETPKSLLTLPSRPVKVPENKDMHLTILLLPPLQTYGSSLQHHLRSRAWKGNHDGMSFAIHRIDFVDESPRTRFLERGASARKARSAAEEVRRREAAAGLLGLFGDGGVGAKRAMVGMGGGGAGGVVTVGA
ncbi:hypothetical protein LTR62_001908 [Meristemomyces frigidus]|uniref:Rxt3-domain-containing protein n=1 Tax=Meristemomyces frigidus TaxID=1508187 RepID=A0AAN7YG09_9PEZI|nr:hypothetical protein LTR62_001908 [Meristemomyces frigidus]